MNEQLSPGEPLKRGAKLHSGQEEILEKIMRFPKRDLGELKTVYLVFGSEGVGVTSMLESARDRILDTEAEIVRNEKYNAIRRLGSEGFTKALYHDSPSHVFIVDAGDSPGFDNDRFSDHLFNPQHFEELRGVVRGIPLKEAVEFVNQLGVTNTEMSNEQIAEYSLGIPALAKILAKNEVNLPLAKGIMKWYISSRNVQHGSDIELIYRDFLRIRPKDAPERPILEAELTIGSLYTLPEDIRTGRIRTVPPRFIHVPPGSRLSNRNGN